MKNIKLVVLVCKPSLLSGTLVILGTAGLLFITNFSYLLKSGLLYDFVLGKGSSVGLIQTSRDTASAFNQTVFGNPTLNKILFFAFWMMIGLFAYVIIVTVSHSISEVETDLSNMAYVNARKTALEHDLFSRIALRISGLLATFLYLWFFVRLLLPLCIYQSRLGIDKINTLGGWGHVLLGVVILAVSLHVSTIILRLIFIKIRLFGGLDSETEMANHHQLT